MSVKRIVVNIETNDISKAKEFYGEILKLDILMDHGWITTYGNNVESKVQISFATEGGNSTPVPDISIEVDDVDEVFELFKSKNYEIIYGITDELWGVRRFFVKDPFGKTVNILSHKE